MIKNAILGAIVGDAIGVPYEFKHRSEIKEVELIPDERRHLPEGTWSDDSSMILCTMDSYIKNGINLIEIGDTFVKWYDENLWTPYGRVFDIGNTTHMAMECIKERNYYGRDGEMDCGNGSLMRILPAIIYMKNKDVEIRMNYIEELSRLTHSHIRCLVGCNIYSEFLFHLLNGNDKLSALDNAIKNIKSFYTEEVLIDYLEIIDKSFLQKKYEDLSGSGYIVKTLETVLWVVCNSESYKDSIVKAIKVGNDTDTIASLTGAATGIIYKGIPEFWIEELARKDDVLELIRRFEEVNKMK